MGFRQRGRPICFGWDCIVLFNNTVRDSTPVPLKVTREPNERLVVCKLNYFPEVLVLMGAWHAILSLLTPMWSFTFICTLNKRQTERYICQTMLCPCCLRARIDVCHFLSSNMNLSTYNNTKDDWSRDRRQEYRLYTLCLARRALEWCKKRGIRPADLSTN